MIVRQEQVPVDRGAEAQVRQNGPFETRRYSDVGGLTQYGAYLETLAPGSRSSERHWHEKEDEFLYMVSGEATLVENDGEQSMRAGDAACWRGGVPNGHHVINRTAAPCTYLIVGTRMTHDVCHYPDSGRVQYDEGENWRIEDRDGKVVRSGTIDRVGPLEGMHDFFFYGLFMDEAVLREKGLEPRSPRKAVVPGFALRIEERALLVPRFGAQAFGMVFSLDAAAAASLYQAPGLEAYRCSRVLAFFEDGSFNWVLTYCRRDAGGSAPDADYRRRLEGILQRLGLPMPS
jgi:uncharacterized cupin superfamily protein